MSQPPPLPPPLPQSLPPSGPQGTLAYQSPGTVNASDPVAALIPYKNWPALTGYYLGLFSLFPILGLPLAVVAVVFGVMGLRRAAENPAVRGKGHAITALICGSLFGLFNLALVVMVVVGLALRHH
jgi:hypothetical protein